MGADLQPERIGRYRVVKPLGRGGFATVYLCDDRGLDDRVAVKLLADNQAADPESVVRFVAEARVMRNLRTPGVVTVHDVGEQDGKPYFVMEYCERGTLSDRLAALGRPLTVAEATGLAQAISEAMVGLHSSDPPVVHRDIKPDNLLIRRRPGGTRAPVGQLLAADDELIVGDFGLAKVVDLESTKLSLIAYTRGFAPPEQVRGLSGIQPSADVFSCSAVLIAALSGESPNQVFAADDRAFSAEALARTGPLRSELERGIRFDSGSRHRDVMQWAQALTEVEVNRGRAAADHEPTRSVAAPMTPPTGMPVPPASSAQPGLGSPAPSARPGPGSPASSARPDPGSPAPSPSPQPVAPQPSVPDAAALAAFAPPSGGVNPPSFPGSPSGVAAGGASSAAPVVPTGGPGPRAAPVRASRRRPLLFGLSGVLALAAVVAGLALSLRSGGGPTIVGPREAVVGDEIAFVVQNAELRTWVVGEQRSSDAILTLAPSTSGRITVEAETDDGTGQLSVSVVAADSSLRIVGPGHLALGQQVLLRTEGADGRTVTWTVSGQDVTVDQLELIPSEAGTFDVIAATMDGATASRTFTVSDR